MFTRFATRCLALLLSWALMSGLAAAQVPLPRSEAIANMRAWCECVMTGGVCRVENDTRPIPPGAKTVGTPLGELDANVYLSIKQDGPAMCATGAEACRMNWYGDKCAKGMRLMFRQQPVRCARPGEPVALSVGARR